MDKKDEQIRIAQVLGIMDSGGIESCVMNYYRNIDRNKIQFDFIVCEGSKLPYKDEIEKLGGKIYIVPHYKHIIKYIKSVREILKKNNYKIVHAEMNSMSVFPLYCAYKENVKVRIAHSHSTANKKEWKRDILKNILKLFSKIYATEYFACSEHAGKWLFGKKVVQDNELFIMNNAIENERFNYDEQVRNRIRKELNIESKYVIGHIGRFVTQKNHEFLIEIFEQIHKRNHNTILILMGDGKLEEIIKEKVKQKRLEKVVLFLGIKSNVQDYMQAMDILVFPSLYEGLGMVTIEAQINELFVVCSTNVPIEAEISNKIRFLSLKKDEEWIRLIENKENNRKEATIYNSEKSKYNIKLQCEKLERKYMELCENEGKNKVYKIEN